MNTTQCGLHGACRGAVRVAAALAIVLTYACAGGPWFNSDAGAGGGSGGAPDSGAGPTTGGGSYGGGWVNPSAGGGAANWDQNNGCPACPLPSCTGPRGDGTINVRGVISGLTTGGLILADAQAGPTDILAAGTDEFCLPLKLPPKTTYSVSVVLQPKGLSCSVAQPVPATIAGTSPAVIVDCRPASGWVVTTVLLTGVLEDPKAVAVAPDGTVYVGEANAGRVTTYKLTGVGHPLAYESEIHTGFVSPDGLAVDDSGNLYVADSQGNSIVRLQIGLRIRTTLPVSIIGPRAIAVDSKLGTIYASDSAKSGIVPITPAGAQPVFGQSLGPPNGLAFARTSRLLYATSVSSPNVVVMYPDGGWLRNLEGGLEKGPHGVAVDGAGQVFVADWYHRLIKVIPNDGGSASVVAEASGYTEGVAVTEDGQHVYFTDSSGKLSRADYLRP